MIKEQNVDAQKTPMILSDELIRLNSKQAQKDCPTDLRRIVFKRDADHKILIFITNDLNRTAQEIADLYKQRWEIELFFKWIKQNLKIKTFLGRSENAVLIQVLVAMIAYLLLKLTQLVSSTNASLQKIARLFSVNLTHKISVFDLLYPDKLKPKIRRCMPLILECQGDLF